MHNFGTGVIRLSEAIDDFDRFPFRHDIERLIFIVAKQRTGFSSAIQLYQFRRLAVKFFVVSTITQKVYIEQDNSLFRIVTRCTKSATRRKHRPPQQDHTQDRVRFQPMWDAES